MGQEFWQGSEGPACFFPPYLGYQLGDLKHKSWSHLKDILFTYSLSMWLGLPHNIVVKGKWVGVWEKKQVEVVVFLWASLRNPASLLLLHLVVGEITHIENMDTTFLLLPIKKKRSKTDLDSNPSSVISLLCELGKLTRDFWTVIMECFRSNNLSFTHNKMEV